MLRGRESGWRAGGAPNRAEKCFGRGWGQPLKKHLGKNVFSSTPPSPPYMFTSCPLAQEKKKIETST